MSEDPVAGYLSDPQSQNGYVYTRNLPTVLVDPTGANYECTDQYLCGGGTPPDGVNLGTSNDPAVCEQNPFICGGYTYEEDNTEPVTVREPGGPSAGDSPSPGEPGSGGSVGSGEPTPTTIQVDTTPATTEVGSTGSIAPQGAESIDNVGTFIKSEENGGYSGGLQEHHLLPRQFDEPQFEPRNLNIDDYTMRLDANVHRIIHGKGIGHEAS